MQARSWVSTLVGVAAVVVAVWLVARNYQPPKPIGHDPNPAAASDGRDGGTGDAGSAGAGASVGGGDDAGLPLLITDLVEPEVRMDGGVGAVMLDGSPVPPLPMTVPRQVRFGVVLVSYTGAQPSAGGGHPSTRAKTDARALADKLVATAQQDFHAAVQQGDGGSSDDVGRVKLGILEPAPEYVLFTLPVDGVGGPIDTPRGYWIIKRLE
jgi:hypothetical protein